MKLRKPIERGTEGLFLICAATSILSVILITVFIFMEGVPLFFESAGEYPPPGIGEFLFGTTYRPTAEPPLYGILPFITGSLFVTFGALVLAVPIGVSAGIFLAEIAKGRIADFLRGVVEILAGIPSIVYGFFGYMLIGFFLNNFQNPLVDYNAFSASVILAIMTLPTIVNITEVSIRAVPHDYREGSLAVGSSHWQTIWRVLMPAARSGIITGVILGMGRAIGETMAVLMVAGNVPRMPTEGLRSRVRTLTMAVVNDMGYAADDHRVSLFTIAIVLFVFILLLNLATQIITSKSTIKAE